MSKSVILNIPFDENMKKELERRAKEKGLSMSAYVRLIVYEKIKEVEVNA